MQEYTVFFGRELAALRLGRNVSQWSLALKIPYHIRNIQRIEKGITQPGVGLAFRLMQALETRPGDFLAQLAADHVDQLPSSVSPLPEISVSYNRPVCVAGQKSIFGLMLLQARTAGMVSQTAMAKAAGYNLRNINGVEKGRQEPGIMTALALVLATGVDVRDFFNELYAYWLEPAPGAGNDS